MIVLVRFRPVRAIKNGWLELHGYLELHFKTQPFEWQSLEILRQKVGWYITTSGNIYTRLIVLEPEMCMHCLNK